MNKKFVVFASALLFGLFTLTSVQTIAATTAGYGVEATDDCGGENGKSCGTTEKGASGEKKSCCSGGGEAKSCSDKKGEKKETKTETKTEEKKK